MVWFPAKMKWYAYQHACLTLVAAVGAAVGKFRLGLQQQRRAGGGGGGSSSSSSSGGCFEINGGNYCSSHFLS